MERIVGNWRLNRMAAELESDELDFAPVAEALVVDGVAIGGSYGESDDFVEDPIWGFPVAYFKQFVRSSIWSGSAYAYTTGDCQKRRAHSSRPAGR